MDKDIIFSIEPANDAIKEKHCMKNIMKRKKNTNGKYLALCALFIIMFWPEY